MGEDYNHACIKKRDRRIVSFRSCGLFVVSTAVGGVPEILPTEMIKFAEPTVADLVDALSAAIPIVEEIITNEFHEKVSIKASAPKL